MHVRPRVAFACTQGLITREITCFEVLRETAVIRTCRRTGTTPPSMVVDPTAVEGVWPSDRGARGLILQQCSARTRFLHLK